MSTCYYDAGPPASGQKVMLATTAYDSPDASYVYAIQSSRDALSRAGIGSAYLLLSGNCHVDDARNSVVRDFLASDCTDLVFLDADVAWSPDDLVTLCQYDAGVVGGVYPFRRRNDRAVTPAMPVLSLRHVRTVRGDGLLEVEGLPTGFMRIRRGVLEALDVETFSNKGDPMPLIFERAIVDGQRIGGDINFCRKSGVKIFAAPEIRLGHVAKQVLWGSLGEALRRQNGTTLKYVAERIRTDTLKLSHLTEAWDAVGNIWGAHEDILAASIALARKADAPIIEMGSGLSTVLMAAATDQMVFCLEHDSLYAEQTKRLAHRAGVENIGICPAPLKDGWYDQDYFDGLPEKFSFAVVDGPPRGLGNRMGFFDHFADRCDAYLFDDADDKSYREKLETMGTVDMIGDRTALIRKAA